MYFSLSLPVYDEEKKKKVDSQYYEADTAYVVFLSRDLLNKRISTVTEARKSCCYGLLLVVVFRGQQRNSTSEKQLYVRLAPLGCLTPGFQPAW